MGQLVRIQTLLFTNYLQLKNRYWNFWLLSFYENFACYAYFLRIIMYIMQNRIGVSIKRTHSTSHADIVNFLGVFLKSAYQWTAYFAVTWAVAVAFTFFFVSVWLVTEVVRIFLYVTQHCHNYIKHGPWSTILLQWRPFVLKLLFYRHRCDITL